MNKKALGIGFAVLLAIVGGVTYLMASSGSQQANENQPSDTSMINGTQAPTPAAQSSTKPSGEAPTASTPGRYLDYNNDSIKTTAGTKLLFFHAPWCPQCRDLEADIKQKGVPAGVAIIKVDYDTNQDLRKQYGVTLQTTFVKVDNNGQLVEKFVAYEDPSLAAVVAKLL